jgi:L-methionine (R)-S-oxide reductase
MDIMSSQNKTNAYKQLLITAESLIDFEDHWISKLANLSALLHSSLGHFWTGFYIVENQHLFLGPFQGPVACTSIEFGLGVCGTAFQQKQSIVVEDVNQFPGHIACNSESKSEIVIPVIKDQKVIAVLDIDSDQYSSFDDTDKIYLEKLVGLLI